MQLPGRRQPRRTVTASAARATINNSASMRRLVQEKQERALDYYDSLGPIKFAGNFYSRALTKLRLFPAYLDENGERQETEDPAARELLDRIQDPNGGRTNLLGAYGRLRFLVGESYLVCSFDEDLGEKWEMLSFREIRPNGDGTFTRTAGPSLGTTVLKPTPDDGSEPGPGTATVYRLWRPSPVWSQLADSPMLAALDDCEEILLAAASLRSRMRSRLAGNGMLVMANGISPSPLEVVGDEDMLADPFAQEFTEHITAPMIDEGSASAAVPLIVRVDDTLVENGFKWISFRDTDEEYRETGIRTEAIRRLGISLDMPLESMLGLSDSSHWVAWQVDEQSFKVYLQGVCQELVDDFTSAYYRPAARDAGLPNWQRAVIGYDAAEIINHPDRGKDASDLYTARAIGKAAFRDAKGFDDADAPTPEELDEMIGVAVRDGSLAKYGVPSIRAGGLEPAAGEVEKAPAGGGTTDAPTGPTQGSDVEKGPPPGGPDAVISSAVVLDPLLGRVLGAAELAVEHARKTAGSKLRSRANNGCAPCKELLADVPQHLVAATLGRDQVRALNAPPDLELVAGTAQPFVAMLTRWGYQPDQAAAVGDQVEHHAARTLYERQPEGLPAGFTEWVQRLAVEEPVAA
jgi:hypothetical protein